MGKFFGTKEFYKNTMHVAIPIVVQNLIAAFVTMIDNIMVGRLGTQSYSYRGLTAVAAMNITSTISNLFGIFSTPWAAW